MYIAEKFGFDALDPNEDLFYSQSNPYNGPLVNMTTMSQIQRGNYTSDYGYDGFSLYEPPPVEVYIHYTSIKANLLFDISGITLPANHNYMAN